MPSFTYAPPTTATDGLTQTVTLTDRRDLIASATWHAPRDATDGVVQLLDFHTLPPHQRQGHGKRLLAAVIAEATAYHKLRNQPLRRLWVPLAHKRHVLARAFFASHGFTHTATVKDLHRDEDLLVYVRTFN